MLTGEPRPVPKEKLKIPLDISINTNYYRGMTKAPRDTDMSDQEINDFVKGIMDEVMADIRPELEAKQAKFKEKQANDQVEEDKADLEDIEGEDEES